MHVCTYLIFVCIQFKTFSIIKSRLLITCNNYSRLVLYGSWSIWNQSYCIRHAKAVRRSFPLLRIAQQILSPRDLPCLCDRCQASSAQQEDSDALQAMCRWNISRKSWHRFFIYHVICLSPTINYAQ